MLTCQLCSKIFHALQGQYALCHWQAKSLCCAGTWAATLLQSSNVAYKNGVSGPFWCAPQTCMHSTWALQSTHVTSRLVSPIPAGASLSLGASCHCHRASLRNTEAACWLRYAAGATIQILLFGILAIEVKRKAPTAHTVLEIISEHLPRAFTAA